MEQNYNVVGRVGGFDIVEGVKPINSKSWNGRAAIAASSIKVGQSVKFDGLITRQRLYNIARQGRNLKRDPNMKYAYVHNAEAGETYMVRIQ